MKLLITIIIACFSITAKGQNVDIFKRNPMKDYKLKKLLQDSLQRIRPFPPSVQGFTPVQPGVIRFPLKGLFIGENGKGDEIYAMQVDNMPCLVPRRNVDPKMAVAGFEKKDQLFPLLKKRDEKAGGPEKGNQDK